MNGSHLVTFTEEILNGQLHFSRSVLCYLVISNSAIIDPTVHDSSINYFAYYTWERVKLDEKNNRNSFSHLFWKTGVPRNCIKFTGMYLCRGLFLIQMQGSALQFYWKRDSGTGVFLLWQYTLSNSLDSHDF